jgi:formamidase
MLGIVACQVAPLPGNPAGTFDKFAAEVRTLAAQAPAFDMYVFPELYLSAVGSWDHVHPRGYGRMVAESIPGPLTDRIGALAREVGKWIIPGSIFEAYAGRTHNAALAFSPDGELVARYRKLFPWMPFEDSSPGDEYTVFDIPGLGRFGLMICYDGWVPEIPRTLAWMGAEVIIQPTLTRSVDREQELVLARANAIANQCFIVNPNYGRAFGTGRSVIVDPEGRILALGGAGEEFLTQIIDLDTVRHTREFGTAGLNPLWKQLRDSPPPPFPQYQQGFAAGEIMSQLGPMPVLRVATPAVPAGRPPAPVETVPETVPTLDEVDIRAVDG